MGKGKRLKAQRKRGGPKKKATHPKSPVIYKLAEQGPQLTDLQFVVEFTHNKNDDELIAIGESLVHSGEEVTHIEPERDPDTLSLDAKSGVSVSITIGYTARSEGAEGFFETLTELQEDPQELPIDLIPRLIKVEAELTEGRICSGHWEAAFDVVPPSLRYKL